MDGSGYVEQPGGCVWGLARVVSKYGYLAVRSSGLQRAFGGPADPEFVDLRPTERWRAEASARGSTRGQRLDSCARGSRVERVDHAPVHLFQVEVAQVSSPGKDGDPIPQGLA